MKRLRILQVNTLEKTGGAALSTWHLHRAYKERGIVSWMAVGRKESEDPEVFEIPNEQTRSLWARTLYRSGDLVEGAGKRIPGVTLGAKLLRAAADPLRDRDIRRGVEDFHFPGTRRLLGLPSDKPDIVNCQNLHGSGLRDSGYFDLRVLPGLSREVPVVLTLRDMWLLTGHCAHALDCERWKTSCGECPDLAIPPAVPRDATAYNWRRKRRLYAASRVYIITPSQWLMNCVHQSILAPAMVEGRVIHNAVDTALFRPADRQAARATLRLPQDIPVALFTAHGAPANRFKDFTTIEAAVGRLFASDEGCRLLLVCLGGQAPAAPAAAARILFVDHIRDPARVAMYYQAADVYLHSALADSAPRVVLEALACGTPVVATAVGGIPEQIEEGETGFLTPPRDAEAMAARIEQLLADDELRQRMGARAAEVARERFNLDRQVDEHLSFFDEIVSTWRPGEWGEDRHQV